MIELPYYGEVVCFGQRQGWCKNMATWRMKSDITIFHWCDECRNRDNVRSFPNATWTKLVNRDGSLN